MAKKVHYNNSSRRKADDSFIQSFTDRMIEKIKEMKLDWQKPWVVNTCGTPRNFDGRRYAGINTLILAMEQGDKNYELPVWITFHKAKEIGTEVKKGETSTPVWLATKIIFDEDGKKLTNKEYNELSKEEQDKCTIRPYATCFNVFNIAQTKYQEQKPDEYQALKDKIKGVKRFDHENELSELEAWDELAGMIENDEWVCPIEVKQSNEAFYSISKDRIVVPLKEQFEDINLHFSTLLHEMAHSTGAEERLNRLKPNDSRSYAREELVAELTAAVMCCALGAVKTIKKDSVAYLQYWLDEMAQSPEFLKDVIKDVNKATKYIEEHINNVELRQECGKENARIMNKKVEEDIVLGKSIEPKSLPTSKEQKREEWIAEMMKKHANWEIIIMRAENQDYRAYARNPQKLVNITGLDLVGEKKNYIGFKQEMLDTYLPKMVRAGVKVAIVDAPNIVEKNEQKEKQLVDTRDWKNVVYSFVHDKFQNVCGCSGIFFGDDEQRAALFYDACNNNLNNLTILYRVEPETYKALQDIITTRELCNILKPNVNYEIKKSSWGVVSYYDPEEIIGHENNVEIKNIINPLNEDVMARKKEEQQVPETNAVESKEAKKELKDGIQLFQMKSGDFGIREVKNGQASPTIPIKRDAPELSAFFEAVKGQKADVRNAELKKLADKYLTPENLEKAKVKAANTEKEGSKYLRLPEVKPEVATRISDVSTYRMSDGKTLAIRCKIDGVQQSGIPMGERLQNTFLAKAKGTTGEEKKALDVAVAAMAFRKTLEAPSQAIDDNRGMKR